MSGTLGSFNEYLTIEFLVRKIGLLFSFLCILLISFYILKVYYYDRPDRMDIAQEIPDQTLSAERITSMIKSEEPGALKINSIVAFKGQVQKVSYLNDRITILLGADKNAKAFVICDMQEDQRNEIAQIKTNDTITIKGVFKGFLEDAIFLNCVISN